MRCGEMVDLRSPRSHPHLCSLFFQGHAVTRYDGVRVTAADGILGGPANLGKVHVFACTCPSSSSKLLNTPTHDPRVHTRAGVRAGAVPPRAGALAPLRPTRRPRRACRGHGVYPRGHTAGISMHAVSAATYQSRLLLIRTFFC